MTTVLRDKSVVTAICDYAGNEKVDLLTVGTHGFTGVRRLLIGSVAERGGALRAVLRGGGPPNRRQPDTTSVGRSAGVRCPSGFKPIGVLAKIREHSELHVCSPPRGALRPARGGRLGAAGGAGFIRGVLAACGRIETEELRVAMCLRLAGIRPTLGRLPFASIMVNLGRYQLDVPDGCSPISVQQMRAHLFGPGCAASEPLKP